MSNRLTDWKSGIGFALNYGRSSLVMLNYRAGRDAKLNSLNRVLGLTNLPVGVRLRWLSSIFSRSWEILSIFDCRLISRFFVVVTRGERILIMLQYCDFFGLPGLRSVVNE